MTSIERSFIVLKEYFDKLDMEYITQKGLSVWRTEYGLYGSSSLSTVFELCKKIDLEGKRFVDLGSGDGRIALLASLFGPSCGIEGDKTLHENAIKAKEMLQEEIPALSRCELINGDYTKEDISPYDIIFIFADHNWPLSFQKHLLRECSGTLLSQRNIFSPTILKKGKTFWVDQVPFVSYSLSSPLLSDDENQEDDNEQE